MASIVSKDCFISTSDASLESLESHLPSLDATLRDAPTLLVLSAILLPVRSVHGWFCL